MLRVQNHGDGRAFALLMRRWGGPVRRLCTRMTGDAHRGEDLAQEAFARIFTKSDSFKHRARFSTFLWRIALNLCVDERRKAQRRPETEVQIEGGAEDALTPTPASPTAGPAARAMKKERAEAVRAALAELPEQYRSVVVLRHYEGLKFREIAEVLDIPEGTVKSRMAEALTRLARLLQPFGEGG